MNISKFLALFKKAPPIKIPEKQEEKIIELEPSCFAKGIAKLWLDNNNEWTIDRKLVEVPYYGSGGDGLRKYYDVKLKYKKLGIEVRISELKNSPEINVESISVNEEIKVPCNYYDQQVQKDKSHIRSSILSLPYPTLKKRLDKQAKYNSTRQIRIEEVEKIGCPSNE